MKLGLLTAIPVPASPPAKVAALLVATTLIDAALAWAAMMSIAARAAAFMAKGKCIRVFPSAWSCPEA